MYTAAIPFSELKNGHYYKDCAECKVIAPGTDDKSRDFVWNLLLANVKRVTGEAMFENLLK